MAPPTRIAVLGGGLTGLSAAFHAARRFPRAQVVLFERNSRVGGWVRSQRVEVEAPVANESSAISGRTAKASVLLESGPRTLRPGVDGVGRAVLELIHLLGLEDSLVTTPITAPAAINRFIYVPGRRGLHKVPTGLGGMMRSPYLASVLVPSVVRDLLRKKNREQTDSNLPNAGDEWDESVDSFLSRRFGAEFARVMGSALMHGIYAADSRELSVRATFPSLLKAEERGNGSFALGFLLSAFLRSGLNTASTLIKGSNYEMGDVVRRMKGVSVYSFVDGLQTIPRSIEDALVTLPNVTIKTGATGEIRRVRPTDEDLEIYIKEGEPLLFSNVISALPLAALQPLTASTSSTPRLPHLLENRSASVTVASFVFPPSPSAIHPPGFGYLVSRPVHGYEKDTNSEDGGSGFLGAVFDSSAVAAQDKRIDGTDATSHKHRLTKMTVMLGGPYTLSSSQTSIPTILRHLSSHLQRTLPSPVYSAIGRLENCIPTYSVGHVSRMQELKRVLDGPVWAGRLQVVGAGVSGVSVGDCVNAGREAAMAL